MRLPERRMFFVPKNVGLGDYSSTHIRTVIELYKRSPKLLARLEGLALSPGLLAMMVAVVNEELKDDKPE